MSDLAIPVVRLPVRLRLVSGSDRDVTIFLAPDQSVAEFCVSREAFFPAREEKRIRLFARHKLACVSVAIGDEARIESARGGDDEMTYRKRLVDVTISTGVVLRGELRYIPAHEFVRTADYLNEADAFIAVHAEDVVHYIAKAHIETVEEVEAA